MDIEKLGLFIQKRRKELNLTQQELADMIGVTNKAVSKWERGQSIPDITLFKDLAEYLNVEVIDLFSAGDLMEKNQVEKKEVESIMEKAYEVVLRFNTKKVVGIAYYIAMIGCVIGLFTTILVDFIFTKAMTWSLITTSAILGAMLILTVIRFTYTDIKKCIFSVLITSILISAPIVYTSATYLGLLPMVMEIYVPIIIGSIVATLISYVYFSKSNQHVWVKVHIVVIIIDLINIIAQMFVMEAYWRIIPNIAGLAILLMTLPITINKTKTN